MSEADRERSDGELIEQCLAGESVAWERLIRRYERLIYSVAIACGLAPDHRDDVFQTVSCKLFENLNSLRANRALSSWLFITSKREAVSVARRALRDEHLDPVILEERASEEASQDVVLGAVQEEHSMALALEEINKRCKMLLLALYYEDPRPSYQEIAKRIGRPIGSLGPTRGRCLDQLREAYERHGGRPFADPPTGKR